MSMVTGVSPAAAPGGAVRAVELAIGGMTCASCAARVEKKLSKLNGVTATVNFVTETARPRWRWPPRSPSGARGRFTARPWSTRVMARPPWTR